MSNVYAHKTSRKLPRLSFLLAGFPRRVGVVTVFSTLHPLEPNQERRQTNRRTLSSTKTVFQISIPSKVTQTWASIDAIKRAKSSGLLATNRGAFCGL